jgi:hypothetical protein
MPSERPAMSCRIFAVSGLFGVPEWNTELLQISLGQIEQDFRINCMLAEKGEVLAKPKAPRPVADIHGRAPHGLTR